MKITTDQALAFRSSRHHLMEGATSVLEAAGAILGAQAQVESWGYYALASRAKSFPSESAVAAATVKEPSLVRTWGQRDTLHLYLLEDWALFTALRLHWARGGRAGGEPPEEVVQEVAALFQERAVPLARSDFFELLPASYVDSLRDHRGSDGTDRGTRRFAASRVIQALAHRGLIAFWGKAGSEVTYLHRDMLWTGEWPQLDPTLAALDIVRRYLKCFAPATEHDIAHYLGVKVTAIREWMKLLRDELKECSHDEFGRQWILSEDRDAFEEVLGNDSLVLLPGYDTMLMGHANKRWILPDAGWEKAVWRKSAVVYPAILHRGRIVGTWNFTAGGKEGYDIVGNLHPDFPGSLEGLLLDKLNRFAEYSSLTFRPARLARHTVLY